MPNFLPWSEGAKSDTFDTSHFWPNVRFTAQESPCELRHLLGKINAKTNPQCHTSSSPKSAFPSSLSDTCSTITMKTVCEEAESARFCPSNEKFHTVVSNGARNSADTLLKSPRNFPSNSSFSPFFSPSSTACEREEMSFDLVCAITRSCPPCSISSYTSLGFRTTYSESPSTKGPRRLSSRITSGKSLRFSKSLHCSL